MCKYGPRLIYNMHDQYDTSLSMTKQSGFLCSLMRSVSMATNAKSAMWVLGDRELVEVIV